MSAEGFAADEWSGIANLPIGNPASVTSLFEERIKQLLKLRSADIAGVGKRKGNLAALAGRLSRTRLRLVGAAEHERRNAREHEDE